MGAPSTYTHELADRILARICDGESQPSACKAEGVPWKTWCTWVNFAGSTDDQGNTLQSRVERARGFQADVLDAKMQAVVDGVLDGSIEPRVGAVALQGMQWRTPRLGPSRYGDRISAEVTGAGGKPLEMQASQAMSDRAILLAAEEIVRGRHKAALPQDAITVEIENHDS